MTENVSEPTGKGITGAANDSAAAVDRRTRECALELLAQRRKREKLLPRAMFGEPAWEILLSLYGFGEQHTVGRLAELTQTNKSTTIRWIDYLEAHDLVKRQPHADDKRSVLVDLTERASDMLDLYFSGRGKP